MTKNSTNLWVPVDELEDIFSEMIDVLASIRTYYGASNDYRPPYVKDAFEVLDKLDVK